MARMMTPGCFYGDNARTSQAGGFRFLENYYSCASSTPKHAHHLAHFCLVLSGNYDERIQQRTFTRQTSSLMYLPAGVSHAETHHSRVRCFLIEVEPWRLGSLPKRASALADPLAIRTSEIRQLVFKLHREFSQPDEWSALAMESLALEVLALTARQSRTPALTCSPEWLERIRAILHADYARSPTLSKLAKEIGKNPCHVARAFRLTFGMTVGQYLRRLRVRRAEHLLLNTNKPLTEITMECGFADQPHFTRSFKLVTGLTPSAFRRSRSP